MTNSSSFDAPNCLTNFAQNEMDDNKSSLSQSTEMDAKLAISLHRKLNSRRRRALAIESDDENDCGLVFNGGNPMNGGDNSNIRHNTSVHNNHQVLNGGTVHNDDNRDNRALIPAGNNFIKNDLNNKITKTPATANEPSNHINHQPNYRPLNNSSQTHSATTKPVNLQSAHNNSTPNNHSSKSHESAVSHSNRQPVQQQPHSGNILGKKKEEKSSNSHTAVNNINSNIKSNVAKPPMRDCGDKAIMMKPAAKAKSINEKSKLPIKISNPIITKTKLNGKTNKPKRAPSSSSSSSSATSSSDTSSSDSDVFISDYDSSDDSSSDDSSVTSSSDDDSDSSSSLTSSGDDSDSSDNFKSGNRKKTTPVKSNLRSLANTKKAAAAPAAKTKAKPVAAKPVTPAATSHKRKAPPAERTPSNIKKLKTLKRKKDRSDDDCDRDDDGEDFDADDDDDVDADEARALEGRTVKSKIGARTDTDRLIAKVLCRWWYALPPWPPENFDWDLALKDRKLKIVPIEDWEQLDDVDENGFTKVYQISHFPGIYRDPAGNAIDLRPRENKPCYSTFKAKSTLELYELLVKALQGQIIAIEDSPYKLTEKKTIGRIKNELEKELKQAGETLVKLRRRNRMLPEVKDSLVSSTVSAPAVLTNGIKT